MWKQNMEECYMLAAGVMNGLVIWIYNVINWFRRTYYHFKGAVSVYARTKGVGDNKAGSWMFSFDYEGKEQQVTVNEPGAGDLMDRLTTDGGETELLWIPGKKRAMLMRYSDEKTVLICDVVSIALLLLLIVAIVLVEVAISGRTSSYSKVSTYIFMFSVVGMIALGLVRKKFRKY